MFSNVKFVSLLRNSQTVKSGPKPDTRIEGEGDDILESGKTFSLIQEYRPIFRFEQLENRPGIYRIWSQNSFNREILRV